MNHALHAGLWFSMALLVSAALYPTSYRVETLERRLSKLNIDVASEKQNIHVLKAEWVYLTNPVRIAKASEKHLGMQPTALAQISGMDRLREALPTREEALRHIKVAAVPLQTVTSTLSHQIKPTLDAVAERLQRQHLNTRMILKKAEASPLSFSKAAWMSSDGSQQRRLP